MRLKIFLSVALLMIVSIGMWSLLSRNANASKSAAKPAFTIASNIPGVTIENVVITPGQVDNSAYLGFTFVNDTDKFISYFDIASQGKPNENQVLGYYSAPQRKFAPHSKSQFQRVVGSKFGTNPITLRTVVWDDGSWIGAEHVAIQINSERREFEKVATEFGPQMLALGASNRAAYKRLSDNLKEAINLELYKTPVPQNRYSKDMTALAAEISNFERTRALQELFTKLQTMDQDFGRNQDTRSRMAGEAVNHLKRYSNGGEN